MSVVLPVWRRDVKTLTLAWQIRTKWLRERTGASTIAGMTAMLAVILSGSGDVQAQSLQHVTYVGGTALQGNGVHGSMSVSSTRALEFLGPSKLAIPYDHVISYESQSLKRVHLGLLTEGIWRLVAPWPEAKQLTLSYWDANEHSQVVVLEMSKGDEALLVEVLKARVPRRMAPPTTPLLRPPVIGQDKMAKR